MGEVTWRLSSSSDRDALEAVDGAVPFSMPRPINRIDIHSTNQTEDKHQ